VRRVEVIWNVSEQPSRRIFVSYRREDSRHMAGRLFDRLAERFGDGNIFMDVDSIEPGVDFGEAIERAIRGCDVLLALIGRDWVGATDERGRRRLDDPDDLVVLEVRSALDRDLRVIPVLIDGAASPRRTDLPDGIAALARRNAVRLDHDTFRSDIGPLLRALDAAPRSARTVDAPPGRPPGPVLPTEQRPDPVGQEPPPDDADPGGGPQDVAGLPEPAATTPDDAPPPVGTRPDAPSDDGVAPPPAKSGAPPPTDGGTAPPIAPSPPAQPAGRRLPVPALIGIATVATLVAVLVAVLPSRGSSQGGSTPATGATSAPAGAPIVGLITKTATNPFFVKMVDGAKAAAEQGGVELKTYAGMQDGDNQAQVQAIEELVAADAKGFMITPSDAKAIGPELQKARQAGMLVIALDTPTDPADAADATFATDHFEAGRLIGQWAAAQFDREGKRARIGMLDLNANGVTVDVQRDQGFLSGFGIDVADPTRIGDETDPRIIGHDVTDGAEDGGRTAMENLLQKDPSLNLVYAINEPAAAGAYSALRAAGKENDVTVVSIDGGCPGVAAVKAGQLGATAQQYPLKMAQEGVAAIARFAKDGTKPQPTPGKTFVDTGVTLITDQAQPGVDSRDTTFGQQNCWG
jgi:fructose transport system substrate-binding protein